MSKDRIEIPSAFISTKTLPYNTEVGYKASTSGNITGVYDMSGGVHEYVAAYTNANLSSSGFSKDPISIYGKQYFDFYNNDKSSTNFYNRILGDATGEMGPFYIYIDADGGNRIHNNWGGDFTYFVNDERPWFGRGGSLFSGVLGGQFYFERYPGSSDENISFRVVIAK